MTDQPDEPDRPVVPVLNDTEHKDRDVKVLVLAVMLALALGFSAAVLVVRSTQEDVASNAVAVQRADAAARQARTAAQHAQRALEAVQTSRLEQCENANQRFRDTLLEINRQIRELPPGERAEAEAGSADTRELIRRITGGQRDCAEVVELAEPGAP